MADLRRRVEHIIETDPVIRRGLQRGIVNSRALARRILEEDVPESSLGAILGIIRRYSFGDEREDDLRRIFRECELVLKSKIGDLALENGPDIMKRVAEFAGTIRTTRGENLRVMVGMKAIRVIADQKALDGFRQTLSPKEIISYSTNLAEISLLLPQEATKTKGIIAKLSAELALNDVNLVGVMCCAPEDVLLVTEHDAPKALEILQRMVKERTPDDLQRSPRSRPALEAGNIASARKNRSDQIPA